MIGIDDDPFLNTVLYFEYVPPIYAACLIACIKGPHTPNAPIGKRQTSFHQASRGCEGVSKPDPRRAESGRRTEWKKVMEKSRGAVPLRVGRRLDVIPVCISCSSHMGTMNQRSPRL